MASIDTAAQDLGSTLKERWEEYDKQLSQFLRDLTGGEADAEVQANTPRRWLSALRDMTVGYTQDPATLFEAAFDPGMDVDEMIVLRRVPFVSLCEHHLFPFTGTATVGYLPSKRAPRNNRVVGLSKLARLVEVFAKRLQLQERMTKQIAWTLQHNVNPLGVGVVVRGRHTCMSCRGVCKDAVMVTSSLLGVFRSDASVRGEFLTLERGGD